VWGGGDITCQEVVRILQKKWDKCVIVSDEEIAIVTKSDHKNES
jgi:hypothetical protein